MNQAATWIVATVTALFASAAWADEAPMQPDAATSPYQVLVFWASWCGRCDTVLKDMETLQSDDALSGTAIKAVNLGDGASAREALARKGGDRLQLVVDGQALADRLQVKSLPWVVVVNQSGEPVYEPSRQAPPSQVARYVQMDLSLRL